MCALLIRNTYIVHAYVHLKVNLLIRADIGVQLPLFFAKVVTKQLRDYKIKPSVESLIS